jgi:integrase/recombinase XerD
VADFAKYFHRPPDQMGSDEIRTYQLSLLNERKQGLRAMRNDIAALRFFFCKTLRRNYRLLPLRHLVAPDHPRLIPTNVTRE